MLVLVDRRSRWRSGCELRRVSRRVTNLPVREVEVATMQVAVAAENLPMGTGSKRSTSSWWAGRRRARSRAASSTVDAVVGRGLIQPVAANEPLTETKLAPARSRRRAAAVHSARHARAVGQGQRRDRRRRLHRPWHARRRAGDAQRAATHGMSQSRRQQRPGAHRGHAVRSGAGEGRQADSDRRSSRCWSRRRTPSGSRWRRAAGAIMLVLRNPLDVAPTETRGARMASLMGAPDPPPVVKTVERPAEGR